MGAEEVRQEGTVTQRLMVGGPSYAAHLGDVLPVTEAADAVTVIRCGWTALLPPGAWDAAAEALRMMGATPEQIEDRIHVAQFGEIRHAV